MKTKKKNIKKELIKAMKAEARKAMLESGCVRCSKAHKNKKAYSRKKKHKESVI